MKIYKSSKSKFNVFIIYGTIVFMIGITIPIYLNNLLKDIIIATFINVLVILFLLWIDFNTYYKVDNKTIFWQSGPFYGKIAIDKIIKIEHHKGIFVPVIWKPALSHIGLIITYNMYDDIYIAPENEAEFIKHLLKSNPQILTLNKPTIN